ncbi:hypothetical protein DFQ30_004656 [Apophysomyces sp. BC1015]|nr:hypothetical protein DFQ30_004656 [Apophysomyces sp. BC1015]
MDAIFSKVATPGIDNVAQNIHVMMNKATGKTLSDAYVEVAMDVNVVESIKKIKRTPIKGRKLFLMESSQGELMSKLFAGWPGKFKRDGTGILDHPAGDDLDPLTVEKSPPSLIQRKEFESLLAVCRNYKLHFSRKCGERPFEHFISLLSKFPWDQPHIITTMQRDHLYEYYKQATAILQSHVSKPYTSLDPTLMHRMTRAALISPGLTVPQKRGILKASTMECPIDLAHLLEKQLPELHTTTNEECWP